MGFCKAASCLQPNSDITSINYIANAVLKGTDCSLFVDDFALCVQVVEQNRVERAMQLCVNSVQDWVCEKVLSSPFQRRCASTFTSSMDFFRTRTSF